MLDGFASCLGEVPATQLHCIFVHAWSSSGKHWNKLPAADMDARVRSAGAALHEQAALFHEHALEGDHCWETELRCSAHCCQHTGSVQLRSSPNLGCSVCRGNARHPPRLSVGPKCLGMHQPVISAMSICAKYEYGHAICRDDQGHMLMHGQLFDFHVCTACVITCGHRLCSLVTSKQQLSMQVLP